VLGLVVTLIIVLSIAAQLRILSQNPALAVPVT
jgi:hypothetical protein